MTETMMEQTEAAQAETQNEDEKPDFSNYTWFPGVKDKFNAVAVSQHEGRVFLGIKGFDKRSNAHGYIQAEFSREALAQLEDHLRGIRGA